MHCVRKNANANQEQQGCINQHQRQEHFKALIRIRVVPRFTNQSIGLYALCYMSCYIVFNHFIKMKGCTMCFCRNCEYAIRFVHGNWCAIESRSFPRSTWVHTHVRVRDDCMFTIPRERLNQTRIIETYTTLVYFNNY